MRPNKGGAIVNVASVRSVVAGGGNLQYDTTKAAVAGLTRALAADHSPEGIRVNAVGPGPIFTPFHQRRIAAAGETVEQYNAKAAQGTMLKRPGRADEVARRSPVFGLRRCLLRHRRPAVRGRRYDGAVRNTQPALTVHIAQFAALLGDRQVVIAFHERALFDYLTLELHRRRRPARQHDADGPHRRISGNRSIRDEAGP